MSVVPLDLADFLMDRSAIALVNGAQWDMHRPLVEDCTVELLHFHIGDPFHVNRAFWRSCSFMLGSVLEKVFNDEHFVELHSFPAPNGASDLLFAKFFGWRKKHTIAYVQIVIS